MQLVFVIKLVYISIRVCTINCASLLAGLAGLGGSGEFHRKFEDF